MGDSGAGSGIHLLSQTIKDMMPGIYVHCFKTDPSTIRDIEDGYFLSANEQIIRACNRLRNDSQFYSGLHLIGFSQGGLFIRALVERCELKNVASIISIGGPQEGVFGLPKCLGGFIDRFCQFLRKLLSYGVYEDFIQNHLVQAQYWHDPQDEEAYRAKSVFLADINQEVVVNTTYKARLSQVQQIVLVKFKDDTVIIPKESEWFGFFKSGQSKDTYEMEEGILYKEDRLGLKGMNEEGRIHRIEVEGDHLEFTLEWFRNTIITPFLMPAGPDEN